MLQGRFGVALWACLRFRVALGLCSVGLGSVSGLSRLLQGGLGRCQGVDRVGLVWGAGVFSVG